MNHILQWSILQYLCCIYPVSWSGMVLPALRSVKICFRYGQLLVSLSFMVYITLTAGLYNNAIAQRIPDSKWAIVNNLHVRCRSNRCEGD